MKKEEKYTTNACAEFSGKLEGDYHQLPMFDSQCILYGSTWESQKQHNIQDWHKYREFYEKRKKKDNQYNDNTYCKIPCQGYDSAPKLVWDYS